MKDRILRMNLSGYANKVRNCTKSVEEAMEWLKKNLPVEDSLKGECKIVRDGAGEVYLIYDEVRYSWDIVLSTLKNADVVTKEALIKVICNI